MREQIQRFVADSNRPRNLDGEAAIDLSSGHSGEARLPQGVVGLWQTGLPNEREPGLSVRSMGVGQKAIAEYLVSTYYSAAVLVPDALSILENVEVGRTAAQN